MAPDKEMPWAPAYIAELPPTQLANLCIFFKVDAGHIDVAASRIQGAVSAKLLDKVSPKYGKQRLSGT